MTIREALDRAGISRTDAEVLLAAVLQADRTHIVAHPEKPLSPSEQETWTSFLDRRREGEPVSYITGVKEFYGRTFKVDRRVLIPRPATEGLVEEVLEILSKKTQMTQRTQRTKKIDSGIISWSCIFRTLEKVKTIVDVGTGSGCIAITLALELPHLRIIATDNSQEALELAKENAAKLKAGDRIAFLEGSLLKPLDTLKEPFFIVSNPPYIPSDRKLSSDVSSFEPHEALFAGPAGLDVLQPLIESVKKNPLCAGFSIECEEWQISALDGKKTDQ